ncbi:MAG: hypothetical protein WA952_04655, partial [Lewinella sp.]
VLAVVSCLTACFSCAPPQEKDPYAASFDKPLLTTLTLVNAVDSSISISFWPTYLLKGFGQDTPDSIAAGDSLTVTMDLHEPSFVVTELAYRRNTYDLLPGRHRRVVYGATDNVTHGPHANLYRALDRTKEWIPYTIGQELTMLSFEDFLTYMNERGRQALDSLVAYSASRPELPSEVLARMEAEIRLRALKNMTGYANYRRFFYEEETSLPGWLTDTVATALQAYSYGYVPDYRGLLEAITLARRNASLDSVTAKQSAATRNYTALMNVYLALPDSQPGYTARGNVAVELIGKGRDFTDKELIMDSLLQSMPEGYRDRVYAFAESFAASRSDKGLEALFASQLPEEAGDTLVVAEHRETSLTLYKF